MKDLRARISDLKVLVIADIMLDHYISGDATRISPEAPVHVIAVESDKYVLGAAANVVLNASQLGCNTEIIGTIGTDSTSSLGKSLFEKSKIYFDPKFECSSTNTFTKSRIVVRGKQLCKVDRENKKVNCEINESILDEICEKLNASMR